jgi:hypothetical protein
MKIINYFILFVFILLSSCQKELTWDLNAESVGSLKYDVASTLQDCLPSSVVGDYTVDSLLPGNGGANYIQVQVDVTSTGIYTIYSDTLNGYWFRGTGTFGNTGLNSVRLYAYGTPTTAQTDQFVIHYGNSFCTLSVDVAQGTSVQNALYTFGGSGATCTGALLNGTYMQGLTLTSNNTVTINLSVTTPGTYSITTNTINGVTFSGSGVLTTGNTGVTLVASGTPTNAGPFNFLVTGTGNSSSCSFAVLFEPPGTPAVYTFAGAPNNCTGGIPIGTYTAGIAVNSSNSAQINVNVTTIGTYSISTPVVNGINFAATGIFTATGSQTVTLYPSGTPTSSGTYNYDISGSGSSCYLLVTVDGPVNNFITCKLNGVFAAFNINATAGLSNISGPSILSIDGDSISGFIHPSINLQVGKNSGGSVAEGSYNVNQLTSGIGVSCDYYDAANMQYHNQSDQLNQNQNPGFTITVSSITATRCVGSFQGEIKDNNGAGPGVIMVTEGVFNVPRN